MQKSSSIDILTLIAIAAVAFAFANFVHEGAGHGGACVLSGGQPRVLSSVHFDCSIDTRWIAAWGTLANFLLATVCFFLLRVTSAHPHIRFWLWLSMTVNLLQGAGYFLFSGVGNIGDWAVVIHGLQPAWAFRIGLTLLGAATYMGFVLFALRELRPFTGLSQPERGRRARTLCLVPYLAGGTLHTISGLFNPVGMILVAISAVAASFGGTSALAWMWTIPAAKPSSEGPEPEPLGRCLGWIIAGVIAAAIYIGVLGPGIRFSRP